MDLNKLKHTVVKVVFTKSDDTERTMKCTLQKDLINEDFDKIESAISTLNDSVVTVYDVENKAWRRFKVNSVKSFEVA